MVARRQAAPPTPWSQDLAEPQVHETAYVHSFSRVIGDVFIGSNVLVSPGTSIRADEGTPFYIGDSSNIQDGVVIHGLERGRVVGDNNKKYSVWIGKNTCITHMALIHGPAYVGSDCFIGFRSTVFNAKVGDGCIVMMHVLIQDVEIPPGKYIPSGTIITNQQQANRLPDVTEEDKKFAHHVVEINEALGAGYRCAETKVCVSPLGQEILKRRNGNGNGNGAGKSSINGSMINTSNLNAEVVSQVRSLLAQGYKISAEHANKRRFKTKSWLSCGAIQGQRDNQVLAELESFTSSYPGEYVRLIGVDTQAKRRVAEVIIQRPGDQVSPQSNGSSFTGSVGNGSGVSAGGASDDLVGQIRSFLSQGYKISAEHANKRRFKTQSWLSCGAVGGASEAQVISQLQSFLSQYPGEYVQIIAVDPVAKRRAAEVIIQRPDGSSSLNGSSSGSASPSYSNGSVASAGSLSQEALDQVRSLLSQGLKIGTEHASKRRFKTKSWQSCSPIDSNQFAEVVSALEGCLQEHAGEYVRMIGIDANAKRRVSETIIQRPGQAVAQTTTPSNGNGYHRSYSNGNGNGNGNGSSSNSVISSLSTEALAQVRSILSQGLKIGTEHASKRRFKTKSWQSCSPIASSQESEVIAALEACLKEHSGEYIRLIGIDAGAKRRVSETIIQRPA